LIQKRERVSAVHKKHASDTRENHTRGNSEENPWGKLGRYVSLLPQIIQPKIKKLHNKGGRNAARKFKEGEEGAQIRGGRGTKEFWESINLKFCKGPTDKYQLKGTGGEGRR